MNLPDVELLPEERWADMPGYEPYYLVSDHGRVWAKPRKVPRNINGKIFVSNRKSKMVSLGSTLGGYLQASCTDSESRHVKELVHRLVAKAFLPKPESDQYLVQHEDDDPTNNVYTNLSWGTHKTNFDDMTSKGRQVVAIGERSSNSKLVESDVMEIRRLYNEERVSKADLARRFNVTQPCIRSVVARHTWKHI